MISIRINGDEKTVDNGCSLAFLAESFGFTAPYMAISVNNKVISKIQYKETIVKDGDSIEVIEPVGGG